MAIGRDLSLQAPSVFDYQRRKQAEEDAPGGVSVTSKIPVKYLNLLQRQEASPRPMHTLYPRLWASADAVAS